MQIHRALALAALVAINLIAAWRLRQPVAGKASACRHPVAVAWRGRTQVLCQRAPRTRLSEITARLGAGRCGSRAVRAGELVQLAAGCRVAVRPMPAMMRLTLGLPLDVNRASADELRALPGVGPVLARRIVEHRRRHGPFPDVVSLQQVRGIGPRTVARLGGLVSASAYRGAATGSFHSLSK